MDLAKSLSLLVLTGSLLAAQNLPEDPVMRARQARAQAQGISEADLPPVPRSILEPPPLPPPEVHLKDTRGGRAAKGQRKAKAAAATSRRASKGRKPAAVSAKSAAPSRKRVAVSAKPAKRAPKVARKGKS